MQYIENKTFERTDFTINPLSIGEYENCVFNNCDFNKADLSSYKFIECNFKGCNLSLIQLKRTTLRAITFTECKLLGVHFEHCNEVGLALRFEQCTLDHSVFYRLNLKKTEFGSCRLTEVDFTESNLSNSTFKNCDLSGTMFDNTTLDGVDFATAYNYNIDPIQNSIRRAKFSLPEVLNLLNKFEIDIEN